MASSRHVLNISKRLTLIKSPSQDPWPWSADPKGVLVLLLPWLNSKDKHIKKYTDVYSDLGLDVLCMKSVMSDFLWPPHSVKAGGNLIKVLQEQCKDYDKLFVHSLSVGAYNFTTFRMLVNEQESARHLSNKFSGVIYDSVVLGAGKGGIVKSTGEEQDGEKPSDAMELFVRGMASSLSDSKLLFSTMNSLSKIYFTLTKAKTLDYYAKAYDVARDHPLKVPTLFLASKDDPMSDYKVVEHLANIWTNDNSLPVRVQMWEKSKHAQHLVVHNKEYLDVLMQFMSQSFGKSKP